MIMIPMYSELSSPIYYENELRAYEHEIEVCPDSLVTPEYALERRYKVWSQVQIHHPIHIGYKQMIFP